MHEEEKQKNYEKAERILSEQNFSAAAVAGGLTLVLAAVAYGIRVARWPVSYGFAAALIGTVVGFIVGFLWRGVCARFSALTAAYTSAGCILDNVSRAIVEMGLNSGISPIDARRSNSVSFFANRAMSYSSLLDLVYWSVAVFFAVYLARRSLSLSERGD